ARAGSVAWRFGLAACAAAQMACSGGAATTDGDGGPGGKDVDGNTRPKIELTPVGDGTVFELTSGDSLHVIVTDVPDACGYTMRSQVKAGARGIVINIIKNPFV